MTESIHVRTDYLRRTEWFECPFCHTRQEVTSDAWRSVEALGTKPTLDCCYMAPHIPPSPTALRALGDAKALGDLLRQLPRVLSEAERDGGQA